MRLEAARRTRRTDDDLPAGAFRKPASLVAP
jgi:hypothetical protein